MDAHRRSGCSIWAVKVLCLGDPSAVRSSVLAHRFASSSPRILIRQQDLPSFDSILSQPGHYPAPSNPLGRSDTEEPGPKESVNVLQSRADRGPNIMVGPVRSATVYVRLVPMINRWRGRCNDEVNKAAMSPITSPIINESA